MEIVFALLGRFLKEIDAVKIKLLIKNENLKSNLRK
jgi:hypothetical protein